MKKKTPKIIRDVGFDFWWDNEKVWKVDVPVESMLMSELEWHFNIPFWNTTNGYYDLKPIDVIKFPDRYREEYERTMKCDLKYPIDVMENKGRLLVLDGLHRLVKAKILGKRKVDVRNIPRSEIESIKK